MEPFYIFLAFLAGVTVSSLDGYLKNKITGGGRLEKLQLELQQGQIELEREKLSLERLRLEMVMIQAGLKAGLKQVVDGKGDGDK